MLSRRAFLMLVGGGTGAAAVAALGFRLLPEEGSGSEYPQVRLGEESCSFCGMNISDARFVSAWRSAEGERHFDDIGCMVNAYRRDHPSGDVRLYVHDYMSGEWLDATKASFVVSPSVRTPMAYGVYATATAGAHDAGGASFAWNGLLESLERRG